MKHEPAARISHQTKTRNLLVAGWAAISLTAAGLSSCGAAPAIASLCKDGVLSCTNLVPGSVAVVEWAPSMSGSWTNNWTGLESVTADSNGMIRVNVPVFYRVRQIAPAGMVFIPGGSFAMGNCQDRDEGYEDELPVHSNYVSAFYMDQHEVTKAQLDEVYQWAITNGYHFDHAGSDKGPNHPSCNVSWYDVLKWCNARSEKEGRIPAYYTEEAQTNVYRTGPADVQNAWVNWTAGYRLPTEAEWEKAARGGASGRRFPWSDADAISHSRANYRADTNSYAYDVGPTQGFHPVYNAGAFPYTSPVGSFPPNDYGLYDTAGNLWEWCWDWYGGSYYSSSPGADPQGPATGSNRVLRGGGWGNDAWYCRTACRLNFAPAHGHYAIGFRAVLPAAQPPVERKP